MNCNCITRRTVCSDLFTTDDQDLICDRCWVVMNPVTHIKRSISKQTKIECARLWESKYAEAREPRWFLKHTKIREHLKWTPEVECEYYCAYSTPTTEDTTSITSSTSLNTTLKNKENKEKNITLNSITNTTKTTASSNESTKNMSDAIDLLKFLKASTSTVSPMSSLTMSPSSSSKCKKNSSSCTCLKTDEVALPSNTQGVEAKIKRVDYCKQTGCSERIVSYLSNMRATIINRITKQMKQDPKFINKKKKSEENSDHFNGRLFNKNAVSFITNYFADSISAEEIKTYNRLQSRENHSSINRLKRQLTALIKAKEIKRRKKNPTELTEDDIDGAPLLVGSVAFGRPKTKLIPMYRSELICRCVPVSNVIKLNEAKELVKELKAVIHQDLVKKQVLSDSEKHTIKYFKPHFLTAKDWSDDCIDATILQYFSPNCEEVCE